MSYYTPCLLHTSFQKPPVSKFTIPLACYILHFRSSVTCSSFPPLPFLPPRSQALSSSSLPGSLSLLTPRLSLPPLLSLPPHSQALFPPHSQALSPSLAHSLPCSLFLFPSLPGEREPGNEAIYSCSYINISLYYSLLTEK